MVEKENKWKNRRKRRRRCLTGCVVLCDSEGVESGRRTRAIGEKSYPLASQLWGCVSAKRRIKHYWHKFTNTFPSDCDQDNLTIKCDGLECLLPSPLSIDRGLEEWSKQSLVIHTVQAERPGTRTPRGCTCFRSGSTAAASTWSSSQTGQCWPS